MKTTLTFFPVAVLLLAGAASFSQAATIFALGESGGNLFRLDTATPGTVLNNQSLTGVPSGQSPRAIDFRPSNGLLYMLSTGSTASDARLYTLNLTTGAATVLGNITLTGATGFRHSIDWNPVTDHLHIISASSDTQYLVNPVTLAVTALPNLPVVSFVSDFAYDNNFSGSPSTNTYLYDYNNDELVKATAPGAGTYTSVGFPFAPNISLSASQGLDISAGTAYFNTDFSDGALAAGGADYLFTLNLSTGASTNLGAIGLPTLDISVQPIPEAGVVTLLGAWLGAVTLRRRRA